MVQTVEAVYENGILRPLAPLKLHEAQTVRVQIWSEEASHESAAIIQLLVNAGLVRPSRLSQPPLPDPVGAQERHRLADRLGKAPGKPLSEIIMEERR